MRAIPIKTKKELIQTILENQDKIRQFGVKKIGFFGSFVRDTINDKSDVDFYIEFFPESISFKNFMRLGDFLEEITGRKIEMVTPESLNKFIGKYIVQEVEYVPLAA